MPPPHGAQQRLAVVTGGTSGIGRAFVRALAAERHDVVIVARDCSRLAEACERVETDFGVRAYACSADLATREGLEAVHEALGKLGRSADYLVNSAGAGSPRRFEDTPWADLVRLTDLNCLATAGLCHMLIPGMRTRGFGRILNIASLSALVRFRCEQEMYAAAKAFVVRLSSSLHLRLRKEGIFVTAVCPGLTRTEFHARDGTEDIVGRFPRAVWLDPEAVARQSLWWNERGKTVFVPGRINRLVHRLRAGRMAATRAA